MVLKQTATSKLLSDDALDQVVGGLSHQQGETDAHPELNHPPEASDQHHAPAPAPDGKAPSFDTRGDAPLVHGFVSEKDQVDPWDDSFDPAQSEFADAANEAFMQAWNDGDTDLTPDEAFDSAFDAIRDMMEGSGMEMDNFETDREMALEVFTNALDDGEDPNDAFVMAREAIEEANRGNIGATDLGNN